MYFPDQNICVHKSLIHFTGWLQLKQYIPSKRARYWMKVNNLSERATRYVHAFRMYEGKDSQVQPHECPTYIGTRGKFVWYLAYPLPKKAIIYTIITLVCPFSVICTVKKKLACGTSRKNRKGFPQNLVTKRLQRGNPQV